MNLPALNRSKLLSDEFFAPMESLFNSMANDIFADFKPFTPSSLRGRSYPKIDIRIDGSDYIVEAALPFVKEEDLDVTLDKNVLTIKGKADDNRKYDDGCYVHRELSRSAFSRSFLIPEDLYDSWVSAVKGDISDNIEARLTDGVLTVRLKDLYPNREIETKVSPIKIAINTK